MITNKSQLIALPMREMRQRSGWRFARDFLKVGIVPDSSFGNVFSPSTRIAQNKYFTFTGEFASFGVTSISINIVKFTAVFKKSKRLLENTICLLPS